MKAKTAINIVLTCLVISYLFSCSKASPGYYGNYIGSSDSTRAGLPDTTVTDTFNVSPYFSSANSISIMQPSTGETIHATLTGTDLVIPTQNTVLDGYSLTWSGTGTLSGSTLTLNLVSVGQHSDSTKVSFKGTQSK